MRKSNIKKVALTALSCSALACFSVGIITAGAEDVKNVTIANENSFYAVNGASVLLNTSEVGGVDNNGIRFVFEMSKDQFNSLLVNPEATTKAFKEGVSVGAMVVPTAVMGENVTGETVTTDDVVNCVATATQAIPVQKWTYADSVVEGKEEKVYYACAYLYNLPAVAYDAEISACAYITTGEGTVYTEVTTRSMSYVAGAALDAGEHVGSEGILQNYIPTLSERLYSIDDATLDLSDLKGKLLKVEDKDGNVLTGALTNNVATISGDDVLNNATPTSATGAIETVTVYTTAATYKLPLKVCTDVINSATEFDEMKKFLVDTTVAAEKQSGLTYCKKIEGYYALGNDIDFADGFANGYNSPFSYMNIGYKWSEATGWLGTFDGNGYVIRNLKIVQTTQGTAGTYDNSLFGTIGNGGTVKNVAFENASVANNLVASAVFANAIFGTVDNVYIEATLSTTDSKKYNFVFAGVNSTNRGIVNYAKVSNVTIVVNGFGAMDDVMGGVDTGIAGIKGSMVVIGANESQIHDKYSTLEALTKANAKIKAYTSMGTASQDDTLTACGSTEFASKNGVYTITWNGKTVCETEIVLELSQQLYSIDDATLDLSGVNGDIQSIKDASGNAITYVLNGTTATVSGDDVLNNATPTSATGAIETVMVSTTAATYKLPLKVCTDVINSATEFDEMKKFLVDTTVAAGKQSGLTYCKKIEGYYALGNDIDFADGFANGYNSPFSYMNVGYKNMGWEHGWKATFDGNGHVIRNLKIVKGTQGTAVDWTTSLFGLIHADGVIKDVAFTGGELQNTLRSSAFLANAVYGTIQNVYVEATVKTNTTAAYPNAVFVGAGKAIGVEDAAKISNVTVVVSGLGTNDCVMTGNANEVTGIKGSMVIIGAPETKIHSGYTTLEALTTANANINVYASTANVTATACGSATFAMVDNKLLIKWNGKTVYGA